MEIQTPAGKVSMVHLPEQEVDPAQQLAQARRMHLKAKSLLLQERMAEAVRMLEESVRLNPAQEGAFEAWLLLGKVRMANPAWSSRALEALQKASRLKPQQGEPWGLMGELYHRKGFKANAVACFKRALELDPSVPIPVDMTYLNETPTGGEEASGPGLLGRFRAILARRDSE